MEESISEKKLFWKKFPWPKKLFFLLFQSHVFFSLEFAHGRKKKCSWNHFYTQSKKEISLFFSPDFSQKGNFILAKPFFPYEQKMTKKKKSILSNISNKYLCTCRLRKAKHTNFNSITFFTTLFISLSAILYSTFYFTVMCERHCTSILFLFFIIFDLV